MTIKELNNYYWLKKEIEGSIQDLKELEESSFCKSKVITNMPKSNQRIDMLADYTAKIIDLENLIRKRLSTALDEVLKIEQFMERIENPEVRMIVNLRHIKHMTWEQIGEELNYSRQGIFNKYSRYLKKTIVKI